MYELKKAHLILGFWGGMSAILSGCELITPANDSAVELNSLSSESASFPARNNVSATQSKIKRNESACELESISAIGNGKPQGVKLNKPKTEPMIPKWGLGFMQSHWGYGQEDGKGGPTYGYETQEGFLNHARALRGIDNPYGDHTHPADVMVLDMYWCGGQINGFSCWDWPNNMIWDRKNYPDPEGMIEELHKMNFKVALNYHAGGFESHNEQWMSAFENNLDMGVDVPWLDFWSHGSAAEIQIWDSMRKHFGDDKRLMFMARHYALPNTENAEGGSFNAEGIYMDGVGIETPPNEEEIEKTMPVHWTGDVMGTWLGLEQSIEGIVYGLDGAAGGWSYLHSDTPGHSGAVGPDAAELALRWIQFSDFTTGTRNHGWTPRDVWAWGPEAEEMSYFSRMLRYRLLPYTYTYTNVIWEKAIPLTRPMKLAYPGQADERKFQYMFGDELLVAPVYKSAEELGEKLDVFLPAGEQWVDYWDHTIYSGNQTIQADVSLEKLKYVPLYVKRGAIIPMGPEMLYIDPAIHPDPLTLDIYPKCSGSSSFTMHDDDGETLGYQRGEYARTSFSVDKRAETIEVHVGASVGEYSGKPESRKVILKINLIDEDYSSVKLNGKTLSEAKNTQSILDGDSSTGWAFDKHKKILYIKFSTSTSKANTILVEV